MRNSFTLSYSGISDRLINDIKLSNNGINISVKALWDTGATITCISPEIAKKFHMVAEPEIKPLSPETNTGTRPKSN